MFEYWQDYPPTHVLVAAYLTGSKKQPRSKGSSAAAQNDHGELAQAIALAGGSAKGKLPPAYKDTTVTK